MKITIEENKDLTNIEVIIKCREKNKVVKDLVKLLETKEPTLLGYLEGVILKVTLNEVLYIESVDNKVFLYLEEVVLGTKYKLYEVEELTSKYHFLRCNKSTVINIAKIKKLYPQMNRTILAVMENNEAVYISRKYVKVLQNALEV